MRNYITFANTDLRDYGVYISGSGVFNAPSRAYNEISIPGRNGTLLNNENRLNNIEVTYPAFIYTDFATKVAGLRSFLLSKVGYQRLVDTYHPNEYRLAVFAEGLEVEPTMPLNAGQFELTFNCKPQRFLLSGDTAVTFSDSGTITNPTLFTALPIIRVFGTGSITVNDVTVTITSADEYTDINCELMDAYKGVYPKNDCIQLSGTEFPVLTPGENTITLDGVTAEVTPRWWTV